MFDREHDARVRTAAFEWLAHQVANHGDVLSRKVLATGFVLDGVRIPLVGPQGIFKPQVLREVPLSITTAPAGPYNDTFGPEGLLRYRYRGTDPGHADNRGLRLAMQRRLPLAYFHGVVRGRYVATWPVYVVADDPGHLVFSVAVDDAVHLGLAQEDSDGVAVHDDAESARRIYITAAVRVRLHQRAFRERVLDAYRRQCSFCRLRHEELLDAAHIVPDVHPEGEPLVQNGLSLCTLHHAAFDRSFLGLRPDYVIEVRLDILREHDGPTLVHAIQGLHGARIFLPTPPELRPARDLVEICYEQFRQKSLESAAG
ncbi:MAG: HNH endonuclease [Acidobacteria bacterium]|nr:HNH endonuclease [Acidobacteriota bacterium]